MDSKYILDVYRKFNGKKLTEFPAMSMLKQAYWGMIGMKTVRPLYYIKDYNKEEIKKELQTYGWREYGDHHCENIYTAFVGYYLLPKKFNIDKRVIELSAFMRSGRINREDALKVLDKPPYYEQSWVDTVVRRYFDNDKSKLDDIMKQPVKTFLDYGDYHSKFIRYKFLFWIGMKSSVFPKTFYDKYTKEALIWKKTKR